MNLALLKSTLATGGDHLGDMIFWQLADARVERATLERIWGHAGLDPDLLPEQPTAEKALKLAVRDAQLGQKHRLIRVAREDADELGFGIVREERQADGRLSYFQEAGVQLDRHRGSLDTDHAGHDLVAAITETFKVFRGSHPADDVRRAIVKALHSFAAVTLRDGGGIYWVPSSFADQLRRLQLAVQQIGSSRVYLLPVHRSPEAEQTLGAIAKASIETELASLQTEIAAFLDAPPERPSTLVRRFDAFEALRSRASLYRTVLAVEVENLEQQLVQMSASVEQLLEQKNAA